MTSAGPGYRGVTCAGSGVGDIDVDLTVGSLDRHGEVGVRVADAVRRELGDDQRRRVYDTVGLTGERLTDVSTRDRRCGGSVADQVALAMEQYMQCSRPRSAAIDHRTPRLGRSETRPIKPEKIRLGNRVGHDSR